jgi:hypothetical protein
MGRRLTRCGLAVGLAAAAAGATGARGAERAKDLGDKGGYTLLNPTPRAQMRELSTDRPDTTESPYTVDAGHFQVELSFAEFGRDRTGDTDVDDLTALPVNVKAGILNNVDVQLLLNPYENVREKTAGWSTRTEGFGDATVRLKVNVLGNDGGPVAVGVMPFVTLPSGRGALGADHVQGGLIVMTSAELPGGFGVGAMIQAAYLRQDDGRGYGTSLLHTVTVDHEVWGPLTAYVEYAGTAPIGLGETYRAVIGTGLTLGLGDDVQLDGGVNVGVSDSAEDVRVFVGLSIRL